MKTPNLLAVPKDSPKPCEPNPVPADSEFLDALYVMCGHWPGRSPVEQLKLMKVEYDRRAMEVLKLRDEIKKLRNDLETMACNVRSVKRKP